jgi:hypothetical protein
VATEWFGGENNRPFLRRGPNIVEVFVSFISLTCFGKLDRKLQYHRKCSRGGDNEAEQTKRLVDLGPFNESLSGRVRSRKRISAWVSSLSMPLKSWRLQGKCATRGIGAIITRESRILLSTLDAHPSYECV